MRGFGLLFGFKIPDNFNGPYVAISVGDFWRRWHITFSNWLRDYIYFPLGGSHVPKLRCYLNLFLTMFACGIWHGASWGFIIWGTLHGFALVHYKASLDVARARGGFDSKRDRPTLGRWLRGWLWTFWFVSFSRVFFYSADLTAAGSYVARMFNPGVTGDGFNLLILPIVAVGLFINFYGRGVRESFIRLSDRLPHGGRVALWAAVLIMIVVVRPSGVAPNAYFRF